MRRMENSLAVAAGFARHEMVDTIHLGPNRLAAAAAGGLVSECDFENDDFAIDDIADAAGAHLVATPRLASKGAFGLILVFYRQVD